MKGMLVDLIDCSFNTKRNRLTSAGSNSFGYDDEGQLASGYSTSYTFDDAHRLTAVGSAYQFTYDGAGNRIRAVRSGVTTKYIYDATGNLLAEADGNNVIQRYYIHGAGLLAVVTSANQLYCYHYDATGHTVALTDASKAIVNKYAYTPFGTMSSNTVETIQQPFRFVGQFGVMSEPGGFYYMRARYYDSNVGRFISEDPVGFDGGDVNLFAYVGNNPVMGVDPTGLEIRVYSSNAFGINGLNHAYVWSTEEGIGKGRAGGYGYEWGNGVGNPSADPHVVVPDLKGMTEKQFMDKIYEYPGWNHFLWIPWVVDCHSELKGAFDYAGVPYPGAPNGRVDIDDNIKSSISNTIQGISNGIGNLGKIGKRY
jgi:RHS repeat-associated protein